MERVGVYPSPGYSLRPATLHALEVYVVGDELSPGALVLI